MPPSGRRWLAAGAAKNRRLGRAGGSNRLVAHRYRLEKRIGRGRLGDIFEAIDEAGRDVGARRHVAIQLIDEKIAASTRIVDDLARASERESAVAVVLNRSGNKAARATLAWWVTAGSAMPDEDYADLGQRIERFEPGKESLTVFIPLIRDSTPEETETLYVYVGSYNAARRHLDAMSSMRVTIVDDD